MMERKVEISTGIVIRTILIILSLVFLYFVRDIIALFFVSVILTATFDPFVSWMKKKKVPRPVSVLIVYIFVFSILSLVISFLVPPIISQFRDFSQNIPERSANLTNTFIGIEEYVRSYGISFDSQQFFKESLAEPFRLSGNVFSTTVGVFNFFFSLIVIFSLTFYMLVNEDGMKRFLISVTPKKHQEYVVSLADRISSKVGKWVIGQLALMVIIFILSYLVLTLLNVPYALAIALIAGLLEIVPYVGPIISAVLVGFVGFLISPITGLLALLSFILIQQIENHVIVPQIMKKAVGLNPVAVILALLIGAKLGGVLGALLAVPLATSVGVFAKDLFLVKENETNQ